MKLIEVETEIVKEDLYGRDDYGRPEPTKIRRARLTVVYEGDELEIMSVANSLIKEMVA